MESSHQWGPWWELEVRRSVRLPVEGNLVDYRDLKAGDLRLAVFLAKPDIVRSGLFGMGKDKLKDCMSNL